MQIPRSARDDIQQTFFRTLPGIPEAGASGLWVVDLLCVDVYPDNVGANSALGLARLEVRSSTFEV